MDDLNLIRTPEEPTKIDNYLKKEFEMKDLGKTRYCLSLQIEYCSNDILVHQSIYIEKVLKRFYIDKLHLVNSLMVVCSLKVNQDPFCLKGENEELFGPKVPYLSAINALIYLTNCTRPNITFSINLLARYNSIPIKKHWKD